MLTWIFICCTGFIFLLSSPPAVEAQVCSAPSDVLTSDGEMRSFANSAIGCQSIDGNINIGSCNPLLSCDVTSLSPINFVSVISGSLQIRCCDRLTEISDFQNLQTVSGSIFIYFNRNLAAISGFGSLRNVTSLQISQHPRLRSVTGFSRLSQISGYLEIDRNPYLIDIGGFMSLRTIQGTEVILEHALTVTYNTNLTSLSGLVSLSDILYGTVHIEGNTRLCYAGYPQWMVGTYPVRPEVVGGVDVGIDWRSKLGGRVPSWQYTWGVAGGGYPTLLIQNNAPLSECDEASCDPSCVPGAGCLGPNNASLCGSCRRLEDGSSTCDAVPTPPPGGSNTTAIALGIVIPILIIILLVLAALGIWAGIVLSKRWRKSKKGSFNIAYASDPGSIEGGVKFVSRLSQQKLASEQIAEPTPLGSSTTRSGLRKKPIDNVVMSSYQVKTSSLTRPGSRTTPTRTTPTRNAPSPSSHNSKQRSPISSTHSPPSVPPTSASSSSASPRSDHPMMAKRAPSSWSPSEPRRSSPVATAATSGTVKSSSVRKAHSSAEKEEKMTVESIMEKESFKVPMNFPREQIKLGKEFGEGDFGKVFQADAKRLLPGQKKTTVVVKQLKEGATNEEREVFLRPVEAMKILQHPHVLSLLGVSMQGPAILVLLEYCAQGNFKTFLVRKRREAAAMKQSKQLVKMACDMASGLNYLHSKSIAHNDFAARSCLVTEEGVVKLGDYGITRQTFKEDYYSRGKNQKAWPVRWMAPEQIVVQGRNVLDSLPVSLQANIWSFGVALWEVCSFAQWPYEDMGNEEVIQTVKSTEKCILENPLQPNDPIAPLFDVCLLCWQPFDLRPLMTELLTTLKDILAGGKVRWPSGRGSVSPTHQQQQPNDSEKGQQQPRSSLSGHRPKRPAPAKPPAGAAKTQPRVQREKQENLVIGNPAAHSQDELLPGNEEACMSMTVLATSQASDSSAHTESSSRKAKAQKSHKPFLSRNLSSSSELLLEESSGSQSTEDGGKPVIPQVESVAPPPSLIAKEMGQHVPQSSPSPPEEVDEAAMKTEHKKKKHRKSGEFKTHGEAKSRSKVKSKRKTEQEKSLQKTPKSGEAGEPPGSGRDGVPTQQISQAMFKMSEASMEEGGELPLPQELAEAAADMEEKDDFILEPPLRFSQSSIDYLDDFGDVEDGTTLSIDFAPPTAPSEDEMDEEQPQPPSSQVLKQNSPQLKLDKMSTGQSDASRKKRSEKVKPSEKMAKLTKKTEQKTDFPDMDNEWEGLDYPVRNPPFSRSSQETATGQTRTVFPRNQAYQDDGFAHRNALEEDDDDDECRVVLDEDVAALLW